MDAFFASIEQRDNPQYRGKPLIVGALPGNRGVVCAASYEARTFGVFSAQPISRAFALCPNGIYVAPRMRVYGQVSAEIMGILCSFSPDIEQVSIDEAFLDITGAGRLWGDPLETARTIARTVRERERLTVSIGIAPNKFLAKLASDMNKPAGITTTPFDLQEIPRWLSGLPVGKLWGVGKKTEDVFHTLGIQTIGQVQQCSVEFLRQRFGIAGERLHQLCRGIDERPVEASESAKSLSREHTFDRDTSDYAQWKKTLLFLAADVARQARFSSVKGNVAVLLYRAEDFTKHSRRITLPHLIDGAQPLYKAVTTLLSNAGLQGRMLRLLGVGLTGFASEEQMELFENKQENQAWAASEKALDALTQKFGKNAVVRGVHITGKSKHFEN